MKISKIFFHSQFWINAYDGYAFIKSTFFLMSFLQDWIRKFCIENEYTRISDFLTLPIPFSNVAILKLPWKYWISLESGERKRTFVTFIKKKIKSLKSIKPGWYDTNFSQIYLLSKNANKIKSVSFPLEVTVVLVLWIYIRLVDYVDIEGLLY